MKKIAIAILIIGLGLSMAGCRSGILNLADVVIEGATHSCQQTGDC
jgi:hypothetical protein